MRWGGVAARRRWVSRGASNRSVRAATWILFAFQILAVPARAENPFAAVDCHPQLACSHEAGFAYVDPATLVGSAPSAERDDDGSQWFGGTRNAISDYIDAFATLNDHSYSVALAAAAGVGQAHLVFGKSVHNDRMFCSYAEIGSYPSFAAWTSHNTLGNLCVSSLYPASGRVRNAVLEVRDARGTGRHAYGMLAVRDYDVRRIER